MLFLEPKHIFKEIEMVRKKHQEDSTDSQEGNDGIEAIRHDIVPSGCKKV